MIGDKLKDVPPLIESARADLALQQRRAERGPIGKAAEHGLPLARPAVIRAVRHIDLVLSTVVMDVAVANDETVDMRAIVRTRTVQPAWPKNAPPIEVPMTHLDDAYELRGQRDPASRAVLPAPAEAAAAWLINHLHWLRRLPAPAAVNDAIDTAVESLRSAVDLPRARKYRGPCRVCNAELWSYDGSDTIACDIRHGGCGAVYDSGDLAKFLLDQARPALVTATQASRAIEEWTGLELPAGTIWSWRKRGQIRERAWLHNNKPSPVWIHRNDPPLYRFGDIVDLLTRRPRKDKKK